MPCCCPEFSNGKDPWEAAGTSWSKPENHHLTDSLLTLIKESNTYHKAFRFVLLGSGKVASTGDWPANLYWQLATALFLNRKDSPWKNVDLSDLAETVKNCIMNGLCKAFIKHHDSMSQTDQVKKRFPWYKQMNALYCESPAVDCSTVSNSASQLDLTILNCSQTIDDDDEIPIKWACSPTPEYTKDDDKSSTIFCPSCKWPGAKVDAQPYRGPYHLPQRVKGESCLSAGARAYSADPGKGRSKKG
ncbi:uncharacterized protein BJ212DRAFT_1295717 [Suillus subaureus]|uniref:Uncharacterized protein n=1 Tax=Suillus subaureus TaxID=48587 RepID=A0A9P7JIJ4_9AGAM|nr:uncharacterized protein BJ212DRAFT_1295717 [Suillus subaureus]KAG1824578.1 hypothetical protein BJ212DRAFT_1295717 [Suillus subaureus]